MPRPKKEFNVETFEKLCAIQALETEIANWFDMSHDTINRRCHEVYGDSFANTYKKYSENGKISLRRKQVQVALGGNVTMLIWLGKQILNQTDKAEQKVQFEGDIKYEEKFKEHAGEISRRFGIALP